MTLLIAILCFLGIGLAYGVLAVVWMQRGCRNAGNEFYWSYALFIMALAMTLWPISILAIMVFAAEWYIYGWE